MKIGKDAKCELKIKSSVKPEFFEHKGSFYSVFDGPAAVTVIERAVVAEPPEFDYNLFKVHHSNNSKKNQMAPYHLSLSCPYLSRAVKKSGQIIDSGLNYLPKHVCKACLAKQDNEVP